jgi:hypothetical protein
MKKITITTIPHKKQRYETVGDYYPKQKGWQFNISDMKNPDYEFAVAVHELIEHHLADRRGVKNSDIDKFDIQYEKERASGLHSANAEAGNNRKCPVYREHQFATKIEKMLIEKMGLCWKEYDKVVMSL